jgi:mannose-6-phosphate isomerase-like protein (cupin superfamily)
MQEIVMPPDGTANIAQSPEDLRAKVTAQVADRKPTFFKLEAQLPQQGRTDTPVAASEKMWVVLKTYAADGENGLHAHPNEDHTFVVLQGEATFFGPNDETRTIGKNEGVLLPHGTLLLVQGNERGAIGDGARRRRRVRRDRPSRPHQPRWQRNAG